MTLQIERRRPRPYPRPGAAITVRPHTAPAQSTTAPVELRITAAEPAVSIHPPTRTERPDRFTAAAYASAGVGALLLTTSALIMRLGDVPFDSPAGLLLFTLAAVGSAMTVGGVAAAPRHQDGAVQ